jgi:hypothetical protein
MNHNHMRGTIELDPGELLGNYLTDKNEEKIDWSSLTTLFLFAYGGIVPGVFFYGAVSYVFGRDTLQSGLNDIGVSISPEAAGWNTFAASGSTNMALGGLSSIKVWKGKLDKIKKYLEAEHSKKEHFKEFAEQLFYILSAFPTFFAAHKEMRIRYPDMKLLADTPNGVTWLLSFLIAMNRRDINEFAVTNALSEISNFILPNNPDAQWLRYRKLFALAKLNAQLTGGKKLLGDDLILLAKGEKYKHKHPIIRKVTVLAYSTWGPVYNAYNVVTLGKVLTDNVFFWMGPLTKVAGYGVSGILNLCSVALAFMSCIRASRALYDVLFGTHVMNRKMSTAKKASVGISFLITLYLGFLSTTTGVESNNDQVTHNIAWAALLSVPGIFAVNGLPLVKLVEPFVNTIGGGLHWLYKTFFYRGLDFGYQVVNQSRDEQIKDKMLLIADITTNKQFDWIEEQLTSSDESSYTKISNSVHKPSKSMRKYFTDLFSSSVRSMWCCKDDANKEEQKKVLGSTESQILDLATTGASL